MRPASAVAEMPFLRKRGGAVLTVLFLVSAASSFDLLTIRSLPAALRRPRFWQVLHRDSKVVSTAARGSVDRPVMPGRDDRTRAAPAARPLARPRRGTSLAF